MKRRARRTVASSPPLSPAQDAGLLPALDTAVRPARVDLAGLAARIRAGDERAEGEVVRLFAPSVLSFVKAHIRDCEIACEVLDDVLMAVVLALRAGRVRDTSHLGAFVVGTSRHLVSNRLRRECRQQHVEPLSLDCAIIDPLASYENADHLRVLRTALGILSRVERQILTLTLDEGLEPCEIAARLQLPLACVRQKKCRAVRKISALLRGGIPKSH